MLEPVSLAKKMEEITEAWSPIDIARVNDQVVRMAMLEGEYHWHQHADMDELFYVYRGEIVIQIMDSDDIVLRTGEMAVVQRGIKHCPKSEKPSYVLLFEPFELDTQGR